MLYAGRTCVITIRDCICEDSIPNAVQSSNPNLDITYSIVQGEDGQGDPDDLTMKFVFDTLNFHD